MKILVTGGAGYIGTHTIICLLESGNDVVVIDNLANSSVEPLRRVEKLTGKTLEFHELDLLNLPELDRIFAGAMFDAVIHFAGLKSVGESVAHPVKYYRNNVAGTLNLLQCMETHGVRRLVFSSSATVYGASENVPFVESAPVAATNPYGRTKAHIEEILSDLAQSDDRWRIAMLRYFNPAGAHESGCIGEDPLGRPNNLVPFVAQVAVGRIDLLRVFGGDYSTFDGTGVRDYVHVVDLASGHLAALNFLTVNGGIHCWNLGTGRGASVLQVVEEFSRAAQRTIPLTVVERRPGDSAVSYADPSAAKAALGWSATRSLTEMCEDHWRWQRLNPDGFQTD